MTVLISKGEITKTMKIDRYTKAMLTFIFLALLGLIVARSGEGLQKVHAAAPQAWQYKFLTLVHSNNRFDESVVDAIYEDGNKLDITSQGMNHKVYQLGGQGWELVTVEPASLYTATAGFYSGAGATTVED